MTFPILIQEFVGPNGKGHGMILMREDGEFDTEAFKESLKSAQNNLDEKTRAAIVELRTERAVQQEHACWEHRIEDYECCAVSETLPPVKEMICEELGLDVD